MRLRARLAFAIGFATLVAATVLSGQAVSTSQISGTVSDQSGAVLPGAAVSARQTDTGLVRTTTSGADGSYILNNLPVGPYELRVEKAGFSTFVQSGIVLQVDTNPTINPVLKVGATATTVEVQAAATMVETQTTDVGQVTDSTSIAELPLLNRQAINLVVLEGVANNTPGGDLNSNKNIPTVTFSVAGGLPNGTVYLLDGGTHNDPFNNLNLPLPFPDAMEEFKVETSAMPAQYGEHASAAINAVTKSGTNQFHGDAFEFVRNYLLNARDYFQKTRDSLKQNQYGGVIGGPIRKDKLFFFAGYQGTVTRSNPNSSAGIFVPTQAMLNGDFTTFASAACQGTAVTLAAPFVGNKISPTQFSSVAVNVLKHIPVSTDPTGCGAIAVAPPNNSSERQVVGRIDYLMNSRNTLYGRYLIDDYRNPVTSGAAATANALLSSKTGQSNQDQSVTLGDTFIINSQTTSLTHATLLREGNGRFPSQFFSAPEVGVTNFFSKVPHYTVIGIQGGFSVGGSEPGYWNQTGFQFAQDFDLVRGAHQISFGVDWIHSIMNSDSTASANGTFSFSSANGSTFTGLGLADFMLGDLASFNQSNDQIENDRANYIGLYIQDSWKLNPRFTLNYGLRWEPFLPEQNVNKHAFNFDTSRFTAGIVSSVRPTAPPGLLFPGDPGFPGNGDTSASFKHFAPRIGLVWQPGADAKTTVRAAYGIFGDAPQMFFNVRFGSNAPWGTALSNIIPLTSPGAFSNPWAATTFGTSPFPGANFFPGTPGVPGSGAVYVTDPLNLKPEYLQQWNVSIQRQFGSNLLLSATYVGNETTHLPMGQELNPGVFIAGNCTAGGNFPAPYSSVPDGLKKNGACTQTSNLTSRRQLYLLNPAQGALYGTIGKLNDGGTANYNAMLLSVNRRLTKNFSGFANWTWSHCLSDPPTTELTGPTFMNPANPRADYSNCTSDRRHVVNVAFVADSPSFASPWKKRFLSGWQFSPIFRHQTGNYSTISWGSDVAGNGFGTQRPIQLLASPYVPNKGVVNGYLNYAAFGAPPAGVLPPASGVMKPLSVENPGSVQFDASLTRTFSIHESQKLEFRWDVFNVPNLVNLPAPATNHSTASTFGRFTASASATGPRIMQLALKYVF